MNQKNLKGKTISGLLYRFGERITAQLVSTVVSIVLARILLPEDYGIVSLVIIIITICNTFVSDGLGAALIQKKDADEIDFSTIFWAGLFLSGILYIIIFLVAPFLADFYSNTLLIPIVRVMAIRIPIAAINSVQQAYVSKKLMFKKFFWATLLGTIVSGVAGIIMAYKGYGAWSLVAQYLINVSVDTIMLFLTVEWRPILAFSFKRFKSLISFGWKILISGLIGTIYDELRSLIIARKYSTSDLSFYTKGKQFPQLFGNNISTTITNVMFPVFSEIQEDKSKLKQAVRRSIRVSAYVMNPLLICFAAVAENFVSIVFTDKWLPCVPYIQIFCALYLFKPLKNINKSAMKALGRSDIDLVLNVIEKVIGVSLLIVSMKYGVIYIALSALVTYMIAAMLDAFVNGKILSYTLFEQLKDILPSLILSLFVGLIVLLLGQLELSKLVTLAIQILLGTTIYVGLSIFFKLDTFWYLFNTIKNIFSFKVKKEESHNATL